MKRAAQQFQPIRPAAVSTRDGSCIIPRQFPANADQASVSADLQMISVARPALAATFGDMLSVAVELTLMLPRPLLERFVERVIERLDDLDGDPDLEPIDERERDW